MISLPLPISQLDSALISTCGSSRSRMWNKLAVLSAVAAVSFFGTVQPASAQTALFSGVQAGNFGQVNIGATSPAVSMSFTFETPGTLGLISVLTQGATGLDFANSGTGSCVAGSAYSAGQSCTVNATFTPRFAGARNGAVVLNDSNGNAIATGYLQGTGVGPQVNFLPNTETTVASGGMYGPLYGPYGIAVDGSGNLYIDDIGGGLALKDTLSAGVYSLRSLLTGLIYASTGIAVDGSGSVYLTDNSTGQILKETPTAGGYSESVLPTSGLVRPYGIAVDGSGNVYISDAGTNQAVKETLSGGVYTQSTLPTAGLNTPGGVAVDGSGNVYIVDSGNAQVIEDTPAAGGYSQSILPTSGLSYPVGVAADGNGNIYIADSGSNQVVKETPSGGSYIQSILSTSPLLGPAGVAVDGSGNVYITDRGNLRVLKEDFADAPSLSFATTLPGTTSSDSPQIITVENIGNAALSFPVPLVGSNPSLSANFTLNSTGAAACPLVSAGTSTAGTLTAGASCQLPISFTPGALGALSGALVLTDNSLNAAAPGFSSQGIALSGTAGQTIPAISWAAPAPITYGTPLSAAQLNATATVAGTFTYSPAAGTVLTAGAQSITATFTPSDTTDYASTSATVTLTVIQATSAITWATPPAVAYGTILSGTQLDASSTVAGTFTYSPAAGLFLTAGAQQLTVLFAPADTIDYAAVTASVTLAVNAAPITAPLPQSFGAVNIGTASPAIRLTFTIEVGVTVGSTAVLTEGASGLDFANAGTGSCTANTAFAAGQTCTVNVTFTPKFAGTRYGAVTLYDGNGNVLAASYLQGTGIGPQINYLPGTVSTAASATGGLLSPYALTTDASGNIYIADDAANVIWKETPSGAGYSQSVVPTSSLNSPTGVAVDGSGNIYIADTSNSRVLKESPSPGGYTESVVADSANNGILSPISVAVDGIGDVYFFSSGAVYEESFLDGSYTQTTLPYSGTTNLTGIAVDGYGNVYISDAGNSQVVKETLTDGSFVQSVLPSTGLNYPLGVSVDGNNDVYIADYGNQRVVKETFTGGSYLQSTIFSSPQSYPFSVAVDGGGNVFIADPDNNQVLKEDFADAPDLAFANTATGSTSSDSPQTVTIENTGNAPLNFPVPSTGSNPSLSANFTLNSTGAGVCPLVKAGASSAGTLAAGATCQLLVSFTPEALGSLSGALVLTDNNLNAAAPGYATQRIALSGTGVLPAATITWATPAAITYGTPLSKKQLNASSPVAGKFTYSPAAGAVLTAGSELLTVTFTPSNTAKYAPATATVTLTVNQAIPAIKWATPAAIAYGTALGSAQLDASSTVSGTFSYSPAAGTVLTAGEQLLTASFTPTDTVDYATSTASVTLQVNKAAPVVSWATPAPITYGTALSAAQLNASSAVAGTFSYAPAMGKVLAAGAQALTATFTPADTTDYTTVTVSTTLTVHKATPNMTLASSASSVASGKSITFTATLTGSGAASTGTVAFLNGTKQLGAGTLKSNGAATYATSGLAVGKHTITASYGGDGNYVSVVSAAITVTVTAP